MKLKRKLAFVFAGIFILLIILILIFSFSLLKKPSFKELRDKYYITYSLYFDNVLYEEKNVSFFDGEFSKILGINKEISFNGRNVGETFNVTLNPSEAYGEYKQELVKIIRRKISESRYKEIEYSISVDKEEFINSFGVEPELNLTIGFWKVVEIKDSTITLKLKFKVGEKTEKDYFGCWFEFIEINEQKNVAKLKVNCEQKQIQYGLINITLDDQNIYYELTPIINETIEWDNQKGKVREYNQTHIILDDNHPLAGKEITIVIKILNITREPFAGYCIKHENAPNFDVFIMSYCPFGIQFLKGLLPVWKEFGDKANINVRFVSYTMHGKKEEEENARMICIREEQCEKYIPYLECFVQTGNAQECINKVGINKEKIEDCIKNRASQYLAYDAMLNEKYGVRGSPTVIINGKNVEIWPRSPANIAKTLCKYFVSKPEECNLKFDETNPSPGFGYGVGGGGGSCG